MLSAFLPRANVASTTANPTILCAGANCNSVRPDSKRPFIQLRDERPFNLPTRINVAERQAVDGDSLTDLLKHSAQVVAPWRRQAVNNALKATVPAPSVELPTPPSTPPPRPSATPASSPSCQFSQPWSSQTPPARAGHNDKRKRRTASSGEQTSKVPKLTSLFPSRSRSHSRSRSFSKPNGYAVSSDEESNNGWTTVRQEKQEIEG
ncbi:hypothetical protein QBC36DRAFT_193982 [Triangularia setosa]|uniref:Uncharacterized protein n=1 Tax=Triangularia setosa TaxID=2587417 RepID=A0AAN6W1I3_9PEZI|nr:hypothetical protein QBC36DRAFT_193982 [Podospora setosa]